jgi:glycosyltransferase involved in cell wall biosynthesis
MKLALVHDHLTQEGGAEKVLKIFQEIWPKAPTYTLFYNPKKLGDLFSGIEIKTSFLQKIPGAVNHYQWFLPLMPTATESYNLMNYDIILSSCSALAKGVITNSNSLHICYCHTPTRYLWSDTHRYVEESHYPRWVKKIIPMVLTHLRTWDQLAAQRVDVFVANSKTVAERIKKYYRRQSVIIHPPVQTEKFFISNETGNYYLTGGRLVAYKRFDLAVSAFNQLGIRLKIFGEGPELKKLQKIAKPNIEFLGKVSQKDLTKLYSHCLAFVHPQIEDFGITAVEAMASGRPVIAYGVGGACETVVQGFTGTFFNDQTWEALADTIVRFKPDNFDSQKIKEYANQFNVPRFKQEIKELVEHEWEKKKANQIICKA